MILHNKVQDKSELNKVWKDFQYKIEHSFVENHGFVVFLDINNMKAVNDEYGHISGDRVIKRVAYLLANNLGENDRIVRFGGDEFVLFIPALNKQKIKDCLLQIQKSIETDKYLRIRFNKVNLSMGVTTMTKNNNKSMQELIEEADMLMYAAKCNAPSYLIFDDEEGLDKFLNDKRKTDNKSVRKRAYFSWIIAIIIKEEKNWHPKLLMQVCREIFNMNGYKLLQFGAPNETITRVKWAYEGRVKELKIKTDKIKNEKLKQKLLSGEVKALRVK